MKLEIKHLASYLPYGLKFKGKRKDWVSFCNDIFTLCPIDLDGRFDVIKPILRPLSDLTKEIEVNGEKFVPVNYIEDYNPNTKDINYCAVMNDGTVEMHYYRDYEKLFEWHFDVFGLIEKGLAININEL